MLTVIIIVGFSGMSPIKCHSLPLLKYVHLLHVYLELELYIIHTVYQFDMGMNDDYCCWFQYSYWPDLFLLLFCQNKLDLILQFLISCLQLLTIFCGNFIFNQINMYCSLSWLHKIYICMNTNYFFFLSKAHCCIKTSKELITKSQLIGKINTYL